MPTILALRSSILGDASASGGLIGESLAVLRDFHPHTNVVERDLVAAPVPHLDADAVKGMRAEPQTPAQIAARKLSDELVEELRSADTLLIGAPMYNFGIPSVLKSWFDYVLRAGMTFRYSDAGPEGLLSGKRAIVVMTRGGAYSEGPAVAMDAQEPHLRTLLNFIGITEIRFIRVEKLAFGPEEREAAIAAAKRQIIQAITPSAAKAA